MNHVIVGNCPQCGAPVYVPTVWSGIIPPPSTHSCGCKAPNVTYTSAIKAVTSAEDRRIYSELVTLLHDYALVGESATDTLGRVLTELTELRTAARRYVDACDVSDIIYVYTTPYSEFKSALGEALQ